MNDQTDVTQPTADPAPKPLSEIAKPLSEIALRALAEAAERRALYEQQEAALKANAEINGRGGQDPVRYGDWEIKGLTADF